MSRETSPTRPAGLDPDEYTKRRLDIEQSFSKTRQNLCADVLALRKAMGIARETCRRLNVYVETLKDLGVEYNSTYSSMGNTVDAAWCTHPLYDRLVTIVVQQAETKYDIGKALTEYEYFFGQISENKARIGRHQEEQILLKAKIESLSAGKATATVDCACEADANEPFLDADVLALARKHRTINTHSIATQVFEWFRMQQELAESTQLPVPMDIICAHAHPGPRRPSSNALTGGQTPNLDSFLASPNPISLELSTASLRVTYRNAAIMWRESAEFSAILRGEYAQMKINSFPEPPVGNLIKHECPPDPFWPFINCCRCDVRELIFWQNDYPKCLATLRRAFSPLTFAVQCSSETRNDLARLARAIHTTLEGMALEVKTIDEQRLTLLH